MHTMESPSAWKRWAKRAAWWIAVALVVFGIAWTIWNWVATRRVEQAVVDLREAGFPGTLSIDEVQAYLPGGPPPAPEQNAAPIYTAAFALLDAAPPPDPEWWQEDEIGRFDVSDALGANLSRYEPVFEQLRRAAGRPRCRFERHWPDGHAIQLPDIPRAPDAAKLLAGRALVHFRKGGLDGALADLHTLFALGRAFREDPLLISQLIRLQADALGLDVLETVLPSCPDPRAALARVDLDDVRGGMSRAYGLEATAALSLAASPGHIGQIQGDPEPLWFFRLAAPYVKSEAAHLCGHLRRMALAAREAYPVAIPRVIDLQNRAEAEGGFVTKLLLPSVGGFLEREAEIVSRTTLARLAARCLAHRSEHGAYPSRLEDVSDGELDPLTGEAFILESTEEGGIVLRSAASGAKKVRWELPAR